MQRHDNTASKHPPLRSARAVLGCLTALLGTQALVVDLSYCLTNDIAMAGSDETTFAVSQCFVSWPICQGPVQVPQAASAVPKPCATRVCWPKVPFISVPLPMPRHAQFLPRLLTSVRTLVASRKKSATIMDSIRECRCG